MDSVHSQKKLPMPALEKKMKKFWKRFEQDSIDRSLTEFSKDNAHILPADLLTNFLEAMEDKKFPSAKEAKSDDLAEAKAALWKLTLKYGTVRSYFDYVEGVALLFKEKKNMPTAAKAERVLIQKMT